MADGARFLLIGERTAPIHPPRPVICFSLFTRKQSRPGMSLGLSWPMDGRIGQEMFKTVGGLVIETLMEGAIHVLV